MSIENLASYRLFSKAMTLPQVSQYILLLSYTVASLILSQSIYDSKRRRLIVFFKHL